MPQNNEIVNLGIDNRKGLFTVNTVFLSSSAEEGGGSIDPPKENKKRISFKDENLPEEIIIQDIPSHLVKNKEGVLTFSVKNTWPLEYINGVAIGRHPLEKNSKNNLKYSRQYTQGVGYWIIGKELNILSDTGPDGMPLMSYDDIYKRFVVFMNNINLINEDIESDSDWRRVIFTVNFQYKQNAYIRPILSIPQHPHISLDLRTEPISEQGPHTISFFLKRNGDKRVIGMFQMEEGNIATSYMPSIINTITRGEAKARIESVEYNKITLYYSDGSFEISSFDEKGVFNFPLSQDNWGTKYIDNILLEKV